jgi:hypothetical protein
MTATETASDPERVKLAAQAYIYGYPLVYNLREVTEFVAGGGSLPVQAPFNDFGYARELLGPETKFVSPNNDTLYTLAMCDVRHGPLVLHVPDTGGRYYVLQFVDAWTNNFADIGRRATGTGEASYLLAPEDWTGEPPAGVELLSVPSGVFSIIGRVQVDGEADLPAAHALQDQFTLTPLSAADGDSDGELGNVGTPDPRVGEQLAWWEQCRVNLAAFPPPAADAPFLALATQFGLTATESPYRDPDPGLAEVLAAGAAAGQQMIEELGKGDPAAAINGWSTTLHMFDYNLDRLGLGTLNTAEWKIADRTKAYVTRSVIARGGLWGNHGYEANYAFVWTSEDGDPLDGTDHTYELRLTTTPPVDAFWSLTMYDVPDFYLVSNPIDRYSIGDRTPGLETAEDGSVTIYMQTEEPEAEKRSNWLPAPAGLFRPVIRMYQPRSEVLDGTYALPAVTKTA